MIMMGFSMMLPLLVFSLLCQCCYSATILVDGVSRWVDPTVHIGDSIVFRHKYNFNLYIFRNQVAFDACNFTQATLLTGPDSISYTWHPSRPGFFYFVFHNGSINSCNQLQSKKLSIKVSPTSPPPPELPSPVASPIPAPISGGTGVVVPSSPAFPWPFHPRESASSSFPPAPGPTSVDGASSPMPLVPGHKGGGNDGSSRNGNVPFINSNPAVPLPTGEVDSASIRPLPTSASGFSLQVEVALHVTLLCVVSLLPLIMQ